MRFTKLKMIVMAILVVSAASVFAQEQLTDTGSVILTGSVPKKVRITVTPLNNYDALELDADVSDLAVARVNERSNVFAGYTVKVASTNASAGTPRFTGGAGSDFLEYTLKYDGTAVTFSGAEATITDATTRTSGSGVDKDLAISYNGSAANIYEGTYSDTLTFTIEAK
jgi:hypothetical protein